jgi:hypothetical protein
MPVLIGAFSDLFLSPFSPALSAFSANGLYAASIALERPLPHPVARLADFRDSSGSFFYSNQELQNINRVSPPARSNLQFHVRTVIGRLKGYHSWALQKVPGESF